MGCNMRTTRARERSYAALRYPLLFIPIPYSPLQLPSRVGFAPVILDLILKALDQAEDVFARFEKERIGRGGPCSLPAFLGGRQPSPLEVQVGAAFTADAELRRARPANPWRASIGMAVILATHLARVLRESLPRHPARQIPARLTFEPLYPLLALLILIAVVEHFLDRGYVQLRPRRPFVGRFGLVVDVHRFA